MMNSNTVIQISALSGLAGVLISQLMTGLFGFYSDRRKNRAESRIAFRNKKIEIGENLYYVNTETMAMLQKSISYWKNWNNSRSAMSIDYLKKERNTVNEHMTRINSENWKYNLVSLYFKVTLSITPINEANATSQALFLSILDLTEPLKHQNGPDQEEMYAGYLVKVYDLRMQYQRIHDMLKQDMELVKAELLREFSKT